MSSSHEEKLCLAISDWLPEWDGERKNAAMEEIKQQLKQNRRSSKSGARGILAEVYSQREREAV